MTTNMAGKIDTTTAASGGILSRERTIAKAGFNRWLVPPAALAIHLCIGMAYGFSVFWLPLSRSVGTAIGAKVPACAGAATTFWDKTLGTLTALTATNCEWTQFDLGWMFTLFFVVLGLMISAIGVRTLQLWMLWIGSRGIGGSWLGLGYISPVSTVVKWFPDRRGFGRRVANLRRPWARLFRLHDRRRLRLSRAARRMEPGGLDTASHPQGDDNGQSYQSERRAQYTAILADLGGPVSQRLCGNRDHRRGIADITGDIRRHSVPRTFGRFHAVLRRAKNVGRRDRGWFRRPLLVVQHRRQIFLGDAFRFDRTQDDLFCLLRAWRGLLRHRAPARGLEGGGGFRGRVLHHRLDVRRRICPRARLSRGHVRHAIRRRDPWPFAHRVVDVGDRGPR